MPALYSSVKDWQQTPLAVQLTPFWSYLPAGALDRLLFEASAYANSFTHRKLGAPPTTTVGTGGASSQATSIPLATGINVTDGDVLLFPSTSEVVEVTGVDVTDYTSPPYPANALLNTPLQNPYAAGAAVTVYRQDRTEIFGKRADVFDMNAAGASQAGQVAAMHAPKFSLSGNARILMVNQYPIWSVYKAYQSLTWAGSTEVLADLSNTYIDRATGTMRLSLGYFNPLLSYWRIQYVAGYTSIPHDIRDAVHLLVADMVARAMNPIGGVMVRSEGQMAHLTRTAQSPGMPAPEALHVERAKKILSKYKRKGR